MDTVSIIFLFGFSAILIVDLYKFVKFVIVSKQEGILAKKLSVNVFSFLIAGIAVFLFFRAGAGFHNASSLYKGAAKAEALVGTEFVEYYAQQQEQKSGITITDPETYYLNSIEYSKKSAAIYLNTAIFMLLLGIDGIVRIIGGFNVITENGFRSVRTNDPIPIFAEHDRSNNQIIIKINDLTGKVQKLITFKATPQNLASLGQFIEYEELEIKEEV